ncbi:ribosomal protein L18a [Hamiltosporidium magnivora]|uniref:Ribosomal protein L18a n=1 Tax=Hamiltosporidium magnivora TaxID=148818 RepID=A0A4Q9L5P0_9MICR|nr:ribosomal protein L18a [Hamiltosporidium magnivora]
MVVKNYGIKFYYRSKRCFHNMYKEFRAISRISAVEKLFSDMGGRHEVKNDMIFIVSVSEISDEEVKRPGVKEFCGDEVMFPLFEKNINKKQIKTFKTVDIDRLRKLESGLNAEESCKRAAMGVIKRSEIHQEAKLQ